MFKKGTKAYSIFNFKCPVCNEGEFFISKNPYKLKKAGDLHQKCSECGTKFSKEPGFYYGAMYISYALSVAESGMLWMLIYLFFPNSNYLVYVSVISIGILVSSPYFYALSKIIWANMFFTYNNNKNNIKSRKLYNES